MTALSVLDLMMIGEGKTFTDTLDDSVALARHVKAHGYKRYWVAEHHDLPGIWRYSSRWQWSMSARQAPFIFSNATRQPLGTSLCGSGISLPTPKGSDMTR